MKGGKGEMHAGSTGGSDLTKGVSSFEHFDSESALPNKGNMKGKTERPTSHKSPAKGKHKFCI